MTKDLIGWIADQIEVSSLPDEIGLIVLAALEGDDELAELLDAATVPKHAEADEVEATGSSGGAFLTEITVEGFRGIGAPTTVKLVPKPGLTVIAGRNGSGKSSLSEAVELALTGGTYRWKKKSSVEWRKRWRNLHHEQADIRVGMVEEVAGPFEIRSTWLDGEEKVEAHKTTTQRAGQKVQQGLGDLGWGQALDQFRPILSYDELGGILEGGPSQLYDALAEILGVDQIADALKRIQAQIKVRKAPATIATQERKALNAAASQLDDDRARAAGAHLARTSPDVDALRALATGSSAPPSGVLSTLRAAASLPQPFEPGQIKPAVDRLRESIAAAAAAGAEVSDRSRARLDLLERAAAVHKNHGDMTCPVCHQGTLDDAWSAWSTEQIESERREFTAFDAAQQTFRISLDQARKLLVPLPSTLAIAQQADAEALAARQAWERWLDAPAGNDPVAASELANHLDTYATPLIEAVSTLRSAASIRLGQMDDAWQPLAVRIAAWCGAWTDWLKVEPSVARLQSAEKWLKENDLRLKNERLGPIRDGAKAAWTRLRQESNVELADLELAGTGTQRRVKIDASIDGDNAGTMAVLSQGELHALALSLFLPRAMMAESPFRFLILDDPVQAMDPAKVDGLVELLSDVARERQVIVLSHDDRLSAAVRRSKVDATILEVTRAGQSRVTVTPSMDPATRYLSDAHALIKEWEDDRLEEVAMRRTLPGLMRFAVEAAARDAYFGTRLANGGNLSDVEGEWSAANSTRTKVGLAVFGAVPTNQQLDQWASAPYRKFALRNVGMDMHRGLKPELHPRDALRDVQKLVTDLKAIR